MDANRIMALVFLVSLVSACVPQTKSPPRQLHASQPFYFGAFRDEIPDLEGPVDVAFDAAGRLYILLNEAGEVAVFDEQANPLFRFGGVGGDSGQLRDPRGFCLDAGNLYIADTGNHRVQVFDEQGRWRRAWGTHGREPGQFSRPNAVLVHGDEVYVSDQGNHRVQVFDRKGRFRRSLGQTPNSDQGLRWPVDLGVDPDGRLFVADEGHHQLIIFDRAGQWVDSQGDWGVHPGFFDEPRTLLWRGEDMLALDRRNHRIQRFNREGVWQESWGWEEWIPHQGAGTLHYPDAFAIDLQAGTAVICEQAERRCQRFDGAPATAEDPRPPVGSRSHFGAYIAQVGPLLMVPDPENHYVFTFDMRPELPVELTRFGERGKGFGLLQKPLGVTSLGRTNAVVLCDPLAARLQEFEIDFDPDAKVRFRNNMTRFVRAQDYDALVQIDQATLSPMPLWPLELNAIERHPDGRFFAIDQRNSMIWVFSSDWRYLHHWGGEGDALGQFRMPTDLAFSKDGSIVYVCDSLNGRIQASDDRGQVVYHWRHRQAGQRLQRPFGIASGWDDRVYVTDQTDHRIHVYSQSGDYVRTLSAFGSKIGQLWHPADIDHDHQGRLLVVDQGNHRLQAFSTEGRWLLTFGAGRAFTPRNLPANRRHPGLLEE